MDDSSNVLQTSQMDQSQSGPQSHSYEVKAARASVMAHPMASKKMAKKLFKLIKKASKQKFYLRSGLKMTQSKIRKGETGLVVFAGNVSPIEVFCHLPAVCEDRNLPYVYVPTGRDLGTAMGVKRATLVVMVRPHDDYKELYEECYQEVKLLPPPEPITITLT